MRPKGRNIKVLPTHRVPRKLRGAGILLLAVSLIVAVAFTAVAVPLLPPIEWQRRREYLYFDAEIIHGRWQFWARYERNFYPGQPGYTARTDRWTLMIGSLYYGLFWQRGWSGPAAAVGGGSAP
jgi:hypothetical protein